ncbi:MAG: hypothetical protein INH37_06780, partial [Myxococcaceae bacterium]|nr:hypothetical protein [Myxococcaceae bacterium]
MALDEAGRATVAGRKLGASINALVDLQKGLPERLQTQREKLAKAQRAMEVVAEASGGTSSDVALVRARAFSNSVKGEPATFEPSSDFWLQLVPATLALNEEPQSPEKLRQALATLTPMLESEELAQFPRVRFLEARVAFARGERERAAKALEAALAASANYPPAVAMKRILEK